MYIPVYLKVRKSLPSHLNNFFSPKISFGVNVKKMNGCKLITDYYLQHYPNPNFST